MIYVDEKFENRQEFESLLRQTKELTLEELSSIDNPSSISGTEFERIVYERCLKAAIGTPFEDKVERTEDRAFPDIVAAGFFGIEVKATKKDEWTSIGNSVLESSRELGVEKIYVFFGKLGGEPDIIYRDYESCLKGISVTHYPRYQIDMKLPDSESIFAKMNVTYDELRNSKHPVKPIRAYYKNRLKEGEALWWIDDDLDKTATSDAVIKKRTALSSEEQDDIKADIFVRFPEVFSNSSKKYARVPAYLISAHSIISSSLRDWFTAGGQPAINVEGIEFRIPQIIAQAKALNKRMIRILISTSAEDLSSAWGKRVDNDNTVEAWLKEIDHQTEYLELPVPFSKIMTNGD